MVFLYIFVAFLVGIPTAIYLYFKKKFSYWKDRGIAYIEPEIPIGNGKINGKFANLRVILDHLYEIKNDKPFVGGFFFASPIVCVTDLDLVKTILIRDFNYFHDRAAYYNERDDPLSAHLFSIDGEKWKALRAKISPTFTSGKMKFMYSTVKEVAEKFSEALNQQLEKPKDFEVKDLLSKYTMDVIGNCAFGIECNSMTDPDANFCKYGSRSLESPRLSAPMRGFVSAFPDFSRKRGIKLIADDVSEFFMNVVQQNVEYREKNNIRRNDFLDLLLQLKNNAALDDDKGKIIGTLTLTEIAAQSFLFFFAGFETSSTAMAFALYELALNQDLQEKARKEISEVLEKHNGQFTYEAMNDMKFIDQIFSESLRKYPPTSGISRKASKEYKVPNTDIVLEKGTNVFIPTFAIHRDPAIYPDPEKFDPSRFDPEEVQKRHPTSFLAFGDGPRSCIGTRFGRMQARVGLVTLLRRFRFTPCSKTSLKMTFSIHSIITLPVGGNWLEISRL